MAKFASIIKNLRLERGITQEQLAAQLKVSRSTIGMYETGGREPDFETLEAIADIFNVDMDYLMGRSDTERKVSILPASSDALTLSPAESQMILKFRALDARGQSTVLNALEHEYLAMQGNGPAAPISKHA